MDYTENTVICNCKHVTLADIDNALQRSARFSDVEKEFAEVQKLREEIEQVNADIQKAEHAYDLGKAAELKYGKLPSLKSELAKEEEIAELCNATMDFLGCGERFTADQISVNYDYIGAGYGAVTDAALEAVSMAARTEGLILCHTCLLYTSPSPRDGG